MKYERFIWKKIIQFKGKLIHLESIKWTKPFITVKKSETCKFVIRKPPYKVTLKTDDALIHGSQYSRYQLFFPEKQLFRRLYTSTQTTFCTYRPTAIIFFTFVRNKALKLNEIAVFKVISENGVFKPGKFPLIVLAIYPTVEIHENSTTMPETVSNNY